MKGIVVCVNYDDLLSITLNRNMRHLEECVVVTSPEDERTQRLVASIPSTRCFITDAFYRNGAKFNKGAAIEEAFDALGRDGWILIWDADILLPDSLPMPSLNPEMMYGAPRRLLNDPKRWDKSLNWKSLQLSRETGYPGYFQLFHGSTLAGVRPWYAVHSIHAATGDAHFEGHWPANRKTHLPFEVLHLGPRDVNWFGRASERIDGQAVPVDEAEADRLFREHGWHRPNMSPQLPINHDSPVR